MDFLPEEIDDYVCAHTTPETELLSRLNKATWQKVIMPRMLAGHLQGRVLSMLSHMINPNRVLEVGTYTGYSALCWAEGLQEGGKIHTIDINEEFVHMAQQFWTEAGMNDKIELHIGSGLEVIPSLDGPFDVVFLDADKENYLRYYDLVFDKVRPGGFIIADNVLWSGKVVQHRPDAETRALVKYSKKIHEDPRVENVLFPIRDGLMIARKF